MKKSVALIVLLIVPLVLAQVLDLPNPPPVPDTDNDQIQNTTNTTLETRREDPVAKLETRVVQLENRVSLTESQIAGLSGLSSRIDELERQVSSLRADVEQLKNKPFVDQPASYDSLVSIRDVAIGWFKWSLSIAVLALIGVLGIVGVAVFKRISINEKTKHEIKNYLSTYLSQGYPLESLKEQLKKSGWDAKLTDAVVNELKGGAK